MSALVGNWNREQDPQEVWVSELEKWLKDMGHFQQGTRC